MKIALFANDSKGQAPQIVKDLSLYLKERDIEIPIEQIGIFSSQEAQSISSTLESCDFVVSIGGDGSILHLIHRIGIPHPPLIGVNLGSLGFLADVPAHDIYSSFEAICRGDYHIIDRLVIEGATPSGPRQFAVNEVAIHRGDCPHLVDLAIFVDDRFVNTFSADGVIVSTPSGSTAYSLAAGGPIVTPSLSALVLTPICPHTISNRPIVFMPKESIRIELLRGSKGVDVAFDGQIPSRLHVGETLEIRISPNSFRLVTLASTDFFSTLRTKLGWSGSLRTQ